MDRAGAAVDPRKVIDESPMSAFQWRIVAIMIGLNALDGFDVLSISFASPGIADDWGIDRAALGIVLSLELIGMALGSVILGPVADRIGRRATIQTCLVLMTVGMVGAAMSYGVIDLGLWRVLTGLGIGGMLAATNAAVAEAANARRRSLAVILMAAGYPVGTVVGGSIASYLLTMFEWRAIFVFGACASLAFIPIVHFFAPESISFLAHRGGPRALDRINQQLRKMGHAEATVLPERTGPEKGGSVRDLFSPALARATVLLTLAYFAHIMTFYFILKWIPKIVADMGYAPALAGSVLVWASVGGLVGSLLLGLLTARAPVRLLTIAAMGLSFLLVYLFGQGSQDLDALSLTAAMAGFATNAGVVGLYALIAASFPTHLRASATGLIIGLGRGGSALAPAIAGFLFAGGYGLSAVSLLMGLGSLVAATALLFLHTRKKAQDPVGAAGLEQAPAAR